MYLTLVFGRVEDFVSVQPASTQDTTQQCTNNIQFENSITNVWDACLLSASRHCHAVALAQRDARFVRAGRLAARLAAGCDGEPRSRVVLHNQQHVRPVRLLLLLSELLALERNTQV